MNANKFNFFLLLFVIFFSFSNSYSVLVHAPELDLSADYLYFVNSSTLDIELNFQSINKPLIFTEAKITTLDGRVYKKDFNIPLKAKENVQLTLNINEFRNNDSFYSKIDFESQKLLDLELIIEDLNGEEYLDDSIPSFLSIILFNPMVSLKENIFFNYKDDLKEIVLETQFVPTIETPQKLPLSEFFVQYVIRDSEGVIIKDSVEREFYSLKDIYSSINLDMFKDFESGSYDFTFEFTNIAGSFFSEDFRVIVEEEYLNINLLTTKDDLSLKYFYDSVIELYGNSIFTEEKDFKFTIKTNKNAICYLNLNSIGSQYSEDALLFSDTTSQKMNFNENTFIHSLDISPFFQNSSSKFFWVGCTDPSGFEKKTLQKSLLSLDNPTQNLKFIHHDEELVLDLIYPTDSLLTSNIFTTRLATSTNALCSVSFENEVRELESQDYLDHQRQFNLPNGNYNFQYTCSDILNKNKVLSKNIEIDTSKGVKINLDSIYFSAKNSFDLAFTTSSTTESCRYTMEPRSTDDYDLFTLIGTDTNSFSITLSPLVPNENKFFITCKSGIYSTKEISVIFDQSGPQLSNLSFKSNDLVSENYLLETQDIEVVLDVITRIPVDGYLVELLGNNGSKKYNLSGSNEIGTFNINLNLDEKAKDFSSIKIHAKNTLGKVGNTLSKQFLFDRTKPELRLLQNKSSWLISCIDIETKCSKILYGFSNSQITCNPTYIYEKGDFLDPVDNLIICAKGINSVGLISDSIFSSTGIQITSPPVSFQPNLPEENLPEIINPFENDLDENQSVVVPEDNTPEITPPVIPGDSYTPEETDSTSIIILSALAFIVLLAGGSGYYAYKKGYLNSQLQKLGIKLPGKVQNTSATGRNTYYSPMDKNTSRVPSLTQSSTDKKSKYDAHLSKLNSFLDDTLDKKKEVFNSFKTTQKGRVDSYGDTLARPKSGSNTQNKDFDEFYGASSSNKSTQTSEDDAEKFEAYYKKKKESKKKEDAK